MLHRFVLKWYNYLPKLHHFIWLLGDLPVPEEWGQGGIVMVSRDTKHYRHLWQGKDGGDNHSILDFPAQ